MPSTRQADLRLIAIERFKRAGQNHAAEIPQDRLNRHAHFSRWNATLDECAAPENPFVVRPSSLVFASPTGDCGMTVRTKRQSVSHLWWSGATVANQNDPADGRLARSLRTKRRIVDAALRLIDGDAEKFSAKAVAKRAGVTVRTVFTHYPAIETLLVDISDIVAARFASLIGPIAPSLPLERRIEKFAADQARMFETMRGFHRSIRFWRERSPVIGKRFDCYHDAVREKMRGCFRPELDRISPRSRLYRRH